MERQILCGYGSTIEVITITDGQFNVCYAGLEALGFSPEDMTAKRLAQAKMLAGDANKLWQRGAWTTNGFVYLPKGDILVTSPKYTPFLRDEGKAVEAHRAKGREEAYVGNELEELMDNAKTNPADAVKSGVLLLKRNKLKEKIRTIDFEDVPVTYFLFGEFARCYGSILNCNGLDNVSLSLVDEEDAKRQDRPFSRAFWTGNLYGDMAVLHGRSYLYYTYALDCRVSGVRERSEPRSAVSTENAGLDAIAALYQKLKK